MKNRVLSLVMTITFALSLLAALVPASLASSGSSASLVMAYNGTDRQTQDGVVHVVNWSVWVPPEELEAQLRLNGELRIERAPGGSGKIPDYTRWSAPWHQQSTHRATITRVVLTNITDIGDWAFADFGNLTQVVLANSPLKSIGSSAFNGCTRLTGLYNRSATGSLSHATLSNLESIGNSAFEGNGSLTHLLLTPTIKNIGSVGPGSVGTNVFVGCSSLTQLWQGTGARSTPLPPANPGPGDRIFGYGVDSSGVLMEINNARQVKVLKAPVNLSGSYVGLTLPAQERIIWPNVSRDNIVTIEREAFTHLRTPGLQTISIPASVSSIGDHAFAFNNQMTDAVFLGNVYETSFGSGIFDGAASGFTIIFFPQTNWPAPMWRSYNTMVSDTYITLDNYTIVMAVNTTQELHATVYPPSTARQAVTWTSSSTAVATIAGTEANGNIGVIHAHSVGTTTITATYVVANVAHTQSCTVIVVDRLIPMTGLSLDNDQLVLIAGSNNPPTFPNPAAVLNAIVYPSTAVPFPELVWTSSDSSVAYVDYDVDYNVNPNMPTPQRQGRIVPVSPGTATITVTATTPDGNTMTTSAVVTVLEDPTLPTSFVPVTSITPASVSQVMGTQGVNLNSLFSVQPANATHKTIIWELLSGPGMTPGPLNSPIINIPTEAGTIHLRATITNGISDILWMHPINVSFAQQVSINIESFVPVTRITDVPNRAYVGVPLPLTATVVPENATNKDIVWSIAAAGNTGAFIDPITGMLVTQNTGEVTVMATVRDGHAITTVPGLFTQIADFLPVCQVGVPGNPTVSCAHHAFCNHDHTNCCHCPDTEHTNCIFNLPQGSPYAGGADTCRHDITSYYCVVKFTISVFEYEPNPLSLISDRGGSIEGASERLLAVGETMQVTAVPASGFAFSGWHYNLVSTIDGSIIYGVYGTFANETRPTTQFTLLYVPPNISSFRVEVVAFFIHEGGITPPPLTHYFDAGGTYVRNSGVPYSHTTQKTLDRFSHVTLNGTRLVRHQQYTTGSSRNFTEITLLNGYLDRLSPGIYNLEIHFTDYAVVRAQFTVSVQQQAAFEAPNQFEDVYSSTWYYAHVAYVNDRSWMTPNDSEPWLFRPNDLVTQAEVVVALYRMAGRPSVVNQQGNPLYGINAAHEWARQTGMTPLGGTFNMSRAITRQDVALLVNRMVGGLSLRYPVTREAPNFMDGQQIAQAARTAVTNLYRAEIMNGRVGNTFSPLGNMTRAEYAAVLHRFAVVMGV